MKKIFNIFMLLCATVTMMAQTKSFVVTDKSGNSQFVQKLIFQKNELDERFSWSTNSSGYESSFDIENLQFIARANEEMKTASADEVKQLLEEVSGKDEANASAIVSVLKDNPNVEETYTADDDNVIVQMKGEQGKTVYPMYDLKSPYSELEEVDAIESEMTTKQMVKHNDPVGFYHGDVAIFNFFDGVESYEVQNRMVRFIRKLFYNGGYTVEYYGKNYEIPNRGNFSGENVYEVLRHSSDYKAILIFSHGFVGDDGVRYFATNDLAPHDIIGGYRIYDKELQRHYDTHTVERYNIDPNCILYLGPCYSSPNKGYDDDDFYYDKTVVGWSNKNSIAQVDAAMLFYLMLTEQYTLTRALESTDSQDPYNTRSHRYSTTIFPDIRLESNYKPDNYPNLTLKYDLKHHIKKNNNDGYQYLPIKGSLPNHNRLILRFHVKSVTNRYEQVVQSGVLEKNVNGFTTNLRIPNYLPEGIYKISASIAPIGQSGQDFITIRVINPYVFSFSSNLGENFNLPTLSESETKAPEIFDTNNQPVEEIIVRNGSKREFLIDGYSGHSFVAESYDESVAKVSVSGNRLTVTGVGKGETVISVIDRVNKLSVVKDVTVTGSSSPSSEKETFTVNGVSFNMIKVGKGTFQMGNNSGNYFERPVHQVTLTNEYYVGETEVTQALWKAVMGSNPSYNTSSKQFPVEGISWEDCQEFITNLNSLTGRYFRLPTEAEWEFAARGGNASRGYKYSGSNDPEEVAWCEENSSGKTHEVATKIPNELGIYDMSGNVWEMCNDLFSEYGSEAQINPTGGSRGNSRMIRGCSKSNPASEVTVTVRSSISSDERELGDCGFRLALTSSSVSPLQLSTNAITLDYGLSENVFIISGTGSYSVSSNSNIVTASLSGTTIVVSAVSIGRATVTVTDTMSGQTATIAVTVVDPTPDFTISVNMVSLKVGSASTVEITSGSGSYTATSSVPDIATAVISGNSVIITGHSIGSTLITVKDTRSSQTATIVVMVIADLAISANTVSLKVGGTSTVNITSGNGNYRVVCNKPAIATAALNGTTITITGVAAGTANITVTDTQSGQTATIGVTVTAVIPDLAISANSVSLEVGGTSTVKITAGSGNYRVVSNKPAVATAELSGTTITITGVTAGTATFTVTDTQSGQTANIEITVTGGTQGGLVKEVNGVTYRLYREVTNRNDVRNNGDGTPYYRGRLMLEVSRNGTKRYYEICSSLYITDEGDEHMCMMFDLGAKKMLAFTNSKAADIYYGMDGFAFISSLDNISFSQETVFTSKNWGFFPHFIKTDNQDYLLSHFSFAGYRQMQSTRNSNGTWSSSDVGAKSPSVADEEWRNSDKILVVETNSNTDAVAVDLGLPSGTKWADRNVGASSPEDYGGYYAWGETEEKEVYDWSTYKWCNGSRDSQTKYCTDSSYGTVDNKTELDLEDDVAHVKWGGSWKMPTLDQVKELLDNCSSEWTTVNGVNGRWFTGPNGNSIFLPVAGGRWDSDLGGAGSRGYYWSSTLFESRPNCAYLLDFYSGGADWYGTNRYYGLSVRPVIGNSIIPNLTISTNTVSLKVGGSLTVNITSGSGNYRVVSSKPAVATVALNGTTITITGVVAGTATITVTDVQSGQTITLAVMVIADLTLSSNAASLIVGSPLTINITSGSGNYRVVSDKPAIVTVALNGTTIIITGVAAGTATITVTDTQSNQTASIAVAVIVDDMAVLLGYCPDTSHPHMIDLGLSSGTKWACCNVGASKPLEYGGYYAWGETQTKSEYNWDTYQYGYYNEDGDYSHLVNIGSEIAGTSYDAATANWGAPWRMPSWAQIWELVNNTTSEWTTVNGVNGRKFTGPNGGTIFLPAAGYRWNGELHHVGSWGNYWSSTLPENYPFYAYDLGDSNMSCDDRYVGLPVRPVR